MDPGSELPYFDGILVIASKTGCKSMNHVLKTTALCLTLTRSHIIHRVDFCAPPHTGQVAVSSSSSTTTTTPSCSCSNFTEPKQEAGERVSRVETP